MILENILVEYDDVLNQQRNIIYDLRTKVLEISKQPYVESKVDLEKDIKYVLSIDIDRLQDELDGFSLTRKEIGIYHFLMI
jgi:preprotein translocase subunit SecA